MEAPAYYKPLTEKIINVCGTEWGATKKAMREAMRHEAFADAVAKYKQTKRVTAESILKLCKPVMNRLSIEPEQGWLSYIYDYLASGLFFDEGFTETAQRPAVGFFVTVYEWFLGLEDKKNFDLLTDIIELDDEEIASSDITEQYRQFKAAVADSHYIALMRIGREIKSFDPASHTIGVHNVAVHTARLAKKAGLPVDVALVSASALSHDIGKFGCRGKDAKRIPFLHYYYTWQWLTDCGMPTIAHIAANHSTWDLEFENLQIESLILIYSDFRVRGLRDENGIERVAIYTLNEAYQVIFDKLYDMTQEKAKRYKTVYAKLRDFERFLNSHGVTGKLDTDELCEQDTRDFALLTREESLDALRDLTFENSITLMHTLAKNESFSELLEQARSEKNLHKIRTYLTLFEEYSTYMTRDSKLRTLSFLYELLMHREGDVRRNAARIMGQILANSGPKYRKELPDGVRNKEITAPTVMALLEESTRLWDEYIGLCLHPDVKISAKHAQRIANSLKIVTQSLFKSCDPQEARHYLSPLYTRLTKYSSGNDRFVLVDSILQVPFELLRPSELTTILTTLRHALNGGDDMLTIAVLRCIEKCKGVPYAVPYALDVLDELDTNSPAVLYMSKKVRTELMGGEEPVPEEISEIYLSNLKNAVHWTIKKVQIDELCVYAAKHKENAFHIALHLSNLLCVSEHLPVREHAGRSLVNIANMLKVEECNEIVVDLLRELEIGQGEVARFISPCVGRLICRLPKKEYDECIDELDMLVRGANVHSACTALQTLSVVLYTHAINDGAAFDPEAASRIIGLIFTGIAHYDDTIHSVALAVLCRDFFENSFVPEEAKRRLLPVIAKKLGTLLAEHRDDKLVFFNRAAMLNYLYRFVTRSEVNFGNFAFSREKPAAFFPGTFDPFSSGHKQIVQEIRDRGFEVYLAVDEFSWSKRTLPHRLRRQIVSMSTADSMDVFVFPETIPINIANPLDLKRLISLFPNREVYIVAGSDVIKNASAYRQSIAGGAAEYNHIVFLRDEDGTDDSGIKLESLIRGKLLTLSLPAYYESVSSTRIREYIDKNLDISMLIDPVVQEFIYSHGLYLRSEQLKRVSSPEELYFVNYYGEDIASGVAPADEQAAALSGTKRLSLLKNTSNGACIGFALGKSLRAADIYGELLDLDSAEKVRDAVSGKVLLLEGVTLLGDATREERLMLATELLARSLSDDHTYAIYRSRGDTALEALLPELGFIALCNGVYCVDMRSPVVLIQDVMDTIKPHLASETAVQEAVSSARSGLRRSLCGLFPGVLLMCFSTDMLNHALVRRIRNIGGVESNKPGDGLSDALCVPYGRLLNGMIVPNVVTKALHIDKVFFSDVTGFSIRETHGYSALKNQVMMLNSFNRPLLMVDDIMHNGYRFDRLKPLIKDAGIEIQSVVVGILSGRGKDIMRAQGTDVQCEYFIPNLRYWFTESLQYPFIGGDCIDVPSEESSLPQAINLIMPYTWPRYIARSGEKAIINFSRTALENTLRILRALESRHQAQLGTALTIRRLGEALYIPMLPYKGACLIYDKNKAASDCVSEDIEQLLRLSPSEE